MKFLMHLCHLSIILQTCFCQCIILPQPIPDSVFVPHLPVSLQQKFDNISQNINDLLESTNHSNIGVYFNYVYNQHTIYSNSFGYIDRNDPTLGKPTNNTIFRIASITKVFTDLMLLQLVENGIISSLDEPITNYEIAKDFNPKYPPNSISDAINITFGMLGTHMAGLWDHPPCNRDEDLCNYTTSEMIQRINKYSLIIPPNLYPIYSDLSFDLLGNILANIVNDTWQNYISDNILKPLNMNLTGAVFNQNVKKQMCKGYLGNDNISVPMIDLYWDSPSGQMYSSGSDMGLFLKWIFKHSGTNIATDDAGDFGKNENDEVLSDQTISEWLKPVYMQHDHPKRSAWGMPWEFVGLNNLDIHTKSGAIEGYNSMLYFSPMIKFGGIAYYAQGGLGNDPIWGDVLDIIYSGFDVMIDYLVNNQPTPEYPIYIDNLLGNYSTKYFDAIPVSMTVEWLKRGNSTFVGIISPSDGSEYKLIWDNREESGANSSNIFYLQTIGNNTCDATGGNMELIAELQVDQQNAKNTNVTGFYSPAYWDFKGPRFWTKE